MPGICWYSAESKLKSLKQGGTADRSVLDIILSRTVFCFMEGFLCIKEKYCLLNRQGSDGVFIINYHLIINV